MRYPLLINAAVLLIFAGCAHHSVLVDADRVTLTLKAPGAKNVQIASSLDGYELHQARKTGDSTWVVQLPSDMQFTYFYLVDGKVFLPECLISESDGFGSKDCIYVPGM
jgi:hypothetical protein